jgi:hypothetical protein
VKKIIAKSDGVDISKQPWSSIAANGKGKTEIENSVVKAIEAANINSYRSRSEAIRR